MNNKTRKLRYIRQKNALRKGAIMRGNFITTVPEIEQEGALEDMLNIHVAAFSKKWKTPCKLYRVNANPNPENQIQVAINYTVIAESHADAR